MEQWWNYSLIIYRGNFTKLRFDRTGFGERQCQQTVSILNTTTPNPLSYAQYVQRWPKMWLEANDTCQVPGANPIGTLGRNQDHALSGTSDVLLQLGCVRISETASQVFNNRP